MTVYVDDAYIPFRRYIMCHMMSDQKDDSEIHEFAKSLGLKREWFHTDHYDVTKTVRAKAIKLGAVEIRQIEAVNIRRAKRGQGPLPVKEFA